MWKIAICQTTPMLGDLDHNLNIIEKSIAKVSGKADLILFPELMLTGYNVDKIVENVYQTENSGYIKKIKEMCSLYKIYSVISFIEKDKDNYYISAMLINCNGKFVGTYRKTHLFFDEKKYISEGDSIEVFKTSIGNIGIMICYDLEFPEVARTLALKGADYILVPTANMLPYSYHQFIYAQSRTFENEIPVIVCNRIGKESPLQFFGESIAVKTNGEITKLDTNQEQIEIVEINNKPIDSKLNYLENRRPNKYKSLID
ncbi:carbon-nitrogen hydrolase family protein [Virgibacillus sp. W0181]|uniref:carbon-nitrogen hydrolase family protein n=1 Tax=Virgibacillus sp. W0181 TaxID=3391581 RepID=UPI003F483C17